MSVQLAPRIGEVKPGGGVGLRLIKGGQQRRPVDAELSVADIFRLSLPTKTMAPELQEWKASNFGNLMRRGRRVILSKLLHLPTLYGGLFLVKIGPDGRRVNLGLATVAVVTDSGVAYIAADIAGGASDSSLFKFHGFGTGGTAEAASQTALVTEESTQYVGDVRPTGSQASSTNTYTTAATYSPDSGGTRAITEHGIFTASTVGTMLDRSLFSVINVVASADSLLATYVLTLSSGG